MVFMVLGKRDKMEKERERDVGSKREGMILLPCKSIFIQVLYYNHPSTHSCIILTPKLEVFTHSTPKHTSAYYLT